MTWPTTYWLLQLWFQVTSGIPHPVSLVEISHMAQPVWDGEEYSPGSWGAAFVITSFAVKRVEKQGRTWRGTDRVQGVVCVCFKMEKKMRARARLQAHEHDSGGDRGKRM